MIPGTGPGRGNRKWFLPIYVVMTRRSGFSPEPCPSPYRDGRLIARVRR